MSGPAQQEVISGRSKAGASAAGVGGGTLIALIAYKLPDDNQVKPWLLIVAPSLSIFFSGIWLWLNVKIRNWLHDREIRAVLRTAKKTLEDALNNDQTTQAHRNLMRKELEKLELLAFGHQLKRIQAIEVVTEEALRSTSTKGT